MKIFDKIIKKEKKGQTGKKGVDVKKVENTKINTKKSMKDLYAGGAVKTKTVGDGKKGAEEKIVKSGRAYRVLVKPLITEKASISGTLNKYFFAVADDANKIEISRAVLDVYGIKPTAVNIMSMQGKKTRSGKIRGKRKDWKKAIVTLPKGKSINIYEGV